MLIKRILEKLLTMNIYVVATTLFSLIIFNFILLNVNLKYQLSWQFESIVRPLDTVESRAIPLNVSVVFSQWIPEGRLVSKYSLV